MATLEPSLNRRSFYKPKRSRVFHSGFLRGSFSLFDACSLSILLQICEDLQRTSTRDSAALAASPGGARIFGQNRAYRRGRARLRSRGPR